MARHDQPEAIGLVSPAPNDTATVENATDIWDMDIYIYNLIIYYIYYVSEGYDALLFILSACLARQGKAGTMKSIAGGQRLQQLPARITWACTSGRVNSGIPV
jgi:hypothetical protein